MRLTLTLLAAAVLLATVSLPADARSRRAPQGDYVVAESRFGNGTISGAVRGTDLGPQVQLPSGHWEYCRRSCSETLRVETIDFNEGNAMWIGGGGLANECGIFGCLELNFGRRNR